MLRKIWMWAWEPKRKCPFSACVLFQISFPVVMKRARRIKATTDDPCTASGLARKTLWLGTRTPLTLSPSPMEPTTGCRVLLGTIPCGLGWSAPTPLANLHLTLLNKVGMRLPTKRGKIFTRLLKEVQVAARLGGGITGTGNCMADHLVVAANRACADLLTQKYGIWPPAR